MQQVVSNEPGTACYIDDILVWGATVEEHDYRLRQVLSRCREAGIKLNPSKCKFRVTSVKFFGTVLNAQGVQADKDKILAVAELTTPKNQEELRRYLGMVAYLAKFLPIYNSQLLPPYGSYFEMKPNGAGHRYKRWHSGSFRKQGVYVVHEPHAFCENVVGL